MLNRKTQDPQTTKLTKSIYSIDSTKKELVKMSSKHSLNNSEIMSKPSSALSNQLLTKHALGQQNLETVLNHHQKRIKPSMQGFMNNLRRPKIVWQNFVWIKVKRRQLPTASRLRGSYLKR